MSRRQTAFSLLQASEESPVLARLGELTRESVARLRAVEHLIPAQLLPVVKAGPIEGPVWCLLLGNNAAAAKIRQLLPTLAAQLKSQGREVNSIRLKVQIKRS